LYAIARRFCASLIAIRTSCDDLELIRLRAQQPAEDPRGRDRDVGFDAHLITRREVLANPLEDDPEFWELGVEVIEFHTGTRNVVACVPHASHEARLITQFLVESLPGPARIRVHKVAVSA